MSAKYSLEETLNFIDDRLIRIADASERIASAVEWFQQFELGKAERAMSEALSDPDVPADVKTVIRAAAFQNGLAVK